MVLGNLFTQKDRLLISDAVKKLETTTSGELVPVIAHSSARYFVYVLFYAAIFSYLITFFVAYSFNISILLLPLIGLLIFILIIPILRLKAIKYFLISKRHRELAVREFAKKIFFQKNLHKTRDKTGVLIFISLFERQVLILGDEGINSKIAQEDWENIVHIIKTGIRSKQTIDGLKNGILACKGHLEKFFPIKSDDTNELSNELVLIDEEDLNLF